VTSTTTTTIPTFDIPVSGQTLVLKDSVVRPQARRLLATSHDANIALGGGGSDDPTLLGGTVRVVATAGDGFDATYDLPATGWQVNRKLSGQLAYRYTDKTLQAGPIRNVVVRDGRLVRITGLGSQLDLTLDTEPDPTIVVLTLGNRRFCMSFGGKATFRAQRRYTAHGAPAPIACP
jgi:hypothetical protein